MSPDRDSRGLNGHPQGCPPGARSDGLAYMNAASGQEDQSMAATITRRNLIRVAGVGGGLGVFQAGTSGVVTETLARPTVLPARTGIEPLTIKRRGVGLRGYDPDRAFPGFTLFTPLPTTNKTVYLIDMPGNVVHTWNMPYPA